MKPTSATVAFQQNDERLELDLLSKEGNPHLRADTKIGDDRLTIVLTPEKSTEILELKVVYPYTFEPKDHIFMNGYQSWTVCKEYGIDTRNEMAEQMAKFLRHKKKDNTGDREFTKYPKEYRFFRHRHESRHAYRAKRTLDASF